MQTFSQWKNGILALALLGMSMSGAPAAGRASDPSRDAQPVMAETLAEPEAAPSPPEPARPAAPEAVESLGTSLYISGTLPANVLVPHSAALDPSAETTIEAWIRRGVTGCQTILGKNFGTSYWFGMCSGALNGTSASALGMGYDIGSECCAFKGNLAEVRLWSVARTAEDIRRTMHVRLDEPRPGLVANWHLNDSFADSVGGSNGAATGPGTIIFSGPQPPPRPPLVPIDKDFAILPSARDGFGFVILSNTNSALMIGGYATSAPTSQILRLDLGSGSATAFGAGLPSARYGGAAAYAPSTG